MRSEMMNEYKESRRNSHVPVSHVNVERAMCGYARFLQGKVFQEDVIMEKVLVSCKQALSRSNRLL